MIWGGGENMADANFFFLAEAFLKKNFPWRRALEIFFLDFLGPPDH